MRGSPFSFSNFSRGLNVIDSPYTLQEGECRDVLNMVSSPRGAIKKRFGSTVFASSSVASFPELGVATDKLDRAEDPLNNAGKWTQNGLPGVRDKGADTLTGWHGKPMAFPTLAVTDSFVRADENPLSNGGRWSTFSAFPTAAQIVSNAMVSAEPPGNFGGYWNVAEQANPAASLEIFSKVGGFPAQMRVIVCSDGSITKNWYYVEILQETNAASNEYKVRINKRLAGSESTLTEVTKITYLVGDKLGLTVRAGVVTAWRYNKGTTTWETVTKAADTSLTKGYSGFLCAGAELTYRNFSTGECPPYLSNAYWNVTKQANPAVQVEVAVAPTTVAESFGPSIINDGATGKGYYGVVIPRGSTIECQLWTETSILASAVVSRKMVAGELWGLTLRNERLVLWYKPVAGVWTQACEVATGLYTEGFAGIFSYVADIDAFRLKNFDFGEMSASALPTSVVNTLSRVTVASGTYLIVQAGKKLFSINTAGEVSDITDAGAVTEGLRWSVVQSTSGAPNRVAADGPVYLSNGVDPPRYWSGVAKGTAVAEWTAKPEGAFMAVPKAKYLTYLGNRIWASGIAGDTSALRFSGFSVKAEEGEQPDPTNWPKENVVWFEKDDGDPITGTGIAGSYLMVFKAHKTWAVYDLNEGENRRLSDSVGCVSFRSIVETPQGTFFLTPDQGVFVTNGTTLREVSRNVRPILQGTDTNITRAAKQDQLENASAGYLNGHYYLSYTAQDGSAKTLDYDTVLQSWWLSDLAGNQWVVWEPTTGITSLYTIPNKAQAGVVKAFVPGVYTDSGVNYTGGNGLTCYWLSPWEPFWQYFMRHRFNQPNPKKRIRELFVDGRGELVTLVARKFGNTFETLKGTVDAEDMAAPTTPLKLGSATQETQAVRYWSLGVSRVWSFGFGNNSAEPIEIDSYSCHLTFRKS